MQGYEQQLAGSVIQMEKQDLTMRVASLMTVVSLLTFGALVETYKLLM